MFAFLQAIFPFVFIILWLGGMVTLYLIVARKKYLEYLRAYQQRYPPSDGVPLEWGIRDFRTQWQVWYAHQYYPELEQLRREARQRTLFVILWMFGFPILTFTVIVILTVAGFPT